VEGNDSQCVFFVSGNGSVWVAILLGLGGERRIRSGEVHVFLGHSHQGWISSAATAATTTESMAAGMVILSRIYRIVIHEGVMGYFQFTSGESANSTLSYSIASPRMGIQMACLCPIPPLILPHFPHSLSALVAVRMRMVLIIMPIIATDILSTTVVAVRAILIGIVMKSTRVAIIIVMAIVTISATTPSSAHPPSTEIIAFVVACHESFITIIVASFSCGTGGGTSPAPSWWPTIINVSVPCSIPISISPPAHIHVSIP